MELRRYLAVVQRHRMVAGAAFLVTAVLTVVLVWRQPAVWEATGTANITSNIRGTDPDSQDRKNEANDILMRGVKIGETYATIARSGSVRERAEATIPSGTDVSNVTVDVQVVTDTNVLSFVARGPDPEAAESLAQSVMAATITQVAGLHDAYQITPIDQPKAGSDPVGPKKGMTIILGLILGVILAVVLAFLAEYVNRDEETDVDTAVDPRTGLHTVSYFRSRLREEVSRADRAGGTFSLGSFAVALGAGPGAETWRTPTDRELGRIGEVLPLTVRKDVVIAHLGDGAFGAILPDDDQSTAEETFQRWEAAVGAILEGFIADPDVVSGFSHATAQYRDGTFDGDREAVRIARKMVGRSAPTVVRGQMNPSVSQPTSGRTSNPPPAGNGSHAGAVELAPAEEAPATRPAAPASRSAQRTSQRSKASKRKPRAATRRR